MDPQFQELAKHIADDVVKRLDDVVVKRLGEAEKHLDGVIGKRLDEAEKRLSEGARMNMEELRTATKLAAEGYAATLESIDRRLDRLEQKVDNGFRDHALLLTNHEQRITALEHPR